jgi:hypothetical protein
MSLFLKENVVFLHKIYQKYSVAIANVAIIIVAGNG